MLLLFVAELIRQSIDDKESIDGMIVSYQSTDYVKSKKSSCYAPMVGSRCISQLMVHTRRLIYDRKTYNKGLEGCKARSDGVFKVGEIVLVKPIKNFVFSPSLSLCNSLQYLCL